MSAYLETASALSQAHGTPYMEALSALYNTNPVGGGVI